MLVGREGEDHNWTKKSQKVYEKMYNVSYLTVIEYQRIKQKRREEPNMITLSYPILVPY